MTGIPVCIFAKPPIPGRVKTRIARFVGDAACAQLASAMLRDVWSVVRNTPGFIAVIAAAEPGSFPVDASHEMIWLQDPGDLGCRIEGVLRHALKTAPAAIALGADSPLLTGDHLREACEHLETGDAVLGPSEDGGFYLLGLRTCPPGLLSDVQWSCEETRTQTVARLKAHGMSIRQIRRLADVDTVEDLERLKKQLEQVPKEIAPQTRKWFIETGWSASSFRR